MPYKVYPNATACVNAAEALGRVYAASIAKPWPMPPDLYGPGRQPQPLAAYYQKYWQAPLDPQGPSVLDPTAPILPQRVEVDATALQFAGQAVQITSGATVTLDFSGLVADPVVATAMVAESVG